MTNLPELLNILIFSLIIGSGTIMGMKQEATHTLMISQHIKHVAYAMPQFHATRTPSNLPSDIKDPVIQCTITNIETNKPFRTYIAAKYLFKPETKEPLIEIHHTNNNNHHFKITARCTQNPKLQGNDFLEQFRNVMTPFYETPEKFVCYAYNTHKEDPQELTIWNFDDFKKAKLFKLKRIIVRAEDEIIHNIDKEQNPDVMLMINPTLSHPGKTITQENIYGHGPNGCCNEEALIKSINAMITQ